METRELLQQGFRYALSLTHDRPEAEDLLQDAWAKVLAKPDAPRHKGYLYAVIRNGFLDRRRRDKIIDFVATDTPDRFQSESLGAENKAAQKELLAQALSVLRPEEREALFLHAVEGYTAAEIGERTATPRNSILSLLHRARQKVLAAFGTETAKEVLL